MIVLNILILSISFYVFAVGIKEWQTILSSIHLSDLFKKSSDEVSGVEITQLENVKPRYDVSAFKKRIELMKDEDGLFDLPVEKPMPTDFTGAEIITENYEREMEMVLGRR